MTEKVAILGNSVPLLIQPPRSSDLEKTYSEHLADKGYQVFNKARQSEIVSDMYKTLEEDCLSLFPDHVILNFGIVECTFRARGRRIQNYFNGNAWKNSIIRNSYDNQYLRFFKEIGKRVRRQVWEKPLFAAGLKRRFISPLDFRFILWDICRAILKETPVKTIILVGILPGKEWLEKTAPGTLNSIKEYNLIMEDLADADDNIKFIKTVKMNQSSGDGIHLDAEGHHRLADLITESFNGMRTGQYQNWKNLSPYTGICQRLLNRR